MSVTMKQVLAEIDKDEPNYAKFANLGQAALPHLTMLIDGDDPLKAAKAAWAASLIGGVGAIEILRKAGEHHDAQVRIAVAQGLQNMAATAPTELVMNALHDVDPGVRKLALQTAGMLGRAEFSARVADISQSDSAEFLRSAASETTKILTSAIAAKKSGSP